MALVGMSDAGREANDDERAQLVADITRDSANVVTAHTDDAGFGYELGANVATARNGA